MSFRLLLYCVIETMMRSEFRLNLVLLLVLSILKCALNLILLCICLT
jgi:hypothetical protein